MSEWRGCLFEAEIAIRLEVGIFGGDFNFSNIIVLCPLIYSPNKYAVELQVCCGQLFR
jgi:hypothetical protein